MIDIRPVERDGQYFVELAMDGQPMTPHGAFATSDEAEATAYRFAAVCRVLNQPVTIGVGNAQPARRRAG